MPRLRYTPERQFIWYDCDTRRVLPPGLEPPPDSGQPWIKLGTCYQPRPFIASTLEHLPLITEHFRTLRDCEAWCTRHNQMEEDGYGG